MISRLSTILLAACLCLGQSNGLAQAPAVTNQPASQTNFVGSNVTFTVGVSGAGPLDYQWRFNGVNLTGSILTVAGNGTNGYAGDGGAAANASLNQPWSVAADVFGRLFIADTGNNCIRMVDTNGLISTVAGDGTNGLGDGGQATNAALLGPQGVAVDAFGNVFIADSGDGRVRQVASNGVMTTVAGGGTNVPGSGAPATNASLLFPVGVAVNAIGNLYIADLSNNCIIMVDTNGNLWTVAGTTAEGYSGDGVAATNAELNAPAGVAVDAFGNVYIADQGNNCIREVNTNGIISTVAGKANGGNGLEGFSGDGDAATNASLYGPGGVSVDTGGNLFIADSFNSRVREVGLDGIIRTVAGNGGQGYSGDGGIATAAMLNNPAGVFLDGNGDVFIADTGNSRIREVPNTGPSLLLSNLAYGNIGSYDVVVTSPYGSVTSSVATLAVLGPPSLTAQPSSETLAARASATFGVTAIAWPPCVYQWYFDNAAISGQTNPMLSLPSVSLTNAGSYDVVVTNLYGSVTSRVVTLTFFPLGIKNLAGGSYAISGVGVGGWTYGIQFTDDLSQSNWQTLGQTNADPSGAFVFIEQSDSPQGFYRVSVSQEATNPPAEFTPTNIPGMVYYWDYHDLPYGAATTGWTDRVQNVVLTNSHPSQFNQSNSALGVMLPNYGSASSIMTNPTIAIGSNFTLWMVVRERENLLNHTVPQYACLFGSIGGPHGLMLSNGIIGCDWGNASGTIGGPMMSNWPIDLVYSQGTVYTNGIALSGTLPQPADNFPFETVGDIVHGGSGPPSSPFQGYIQYIGIWTNTLFTAADVSNLDYWVNNNGVSNITSGLSAWWQMNDGSGTNLLDSSGNAYTGTIMGGETWVTNAPTGGGLAFNGSNTFVTTTNLPNTWTNMTLSFWINSALPGGSISGAYSIPLGQSANGPQPGGPGWQTDFEANYIRFVTFDGAGNYAITPQQNVVDDGRWHQCVMELGSSPTNLAAYVDGELVSSSVLIHGVLGYIQTNLPVTMGTVADPVNGLFHPYYDGGLSDVRIYTNHVLTPQEVADLFLWRGQR